MVVLVLCPAKFIYDYCREHAVNGVPESVEKERKEVCLLSHRSLGHGGVVRGGGETLSSSFVNYTVATI